MSGGETPRIVIGPPQVRCVDMEDYARIFNQGFDEAREQYEGAVRTARADAIRDAAAEQRRLAEEARTDVGRAEHEDIADWLEERAGQLAEGGERDDARLGLVMSGEQGLGTCSTQPTQEEIAEVLYGDRTPRWERAYPILRRPYLELADRVLALFDKGN